MGVGMFFISGYRLNQVRHYELKLSLYFNQIYLNQMILQQKLSLNHTAELTTAELTQGQSSEHVWAT